MKTVTLTINGRGIQTTAGETILEVARDNNIYIPALCHNEAVAAYGACRLCMVEISRGDWAKLVTSCLYEVEDGLVVKTNTEKVKNVRRMVVELLLARCLDSEVLQELAKEVARYKHVPVWIFAGEKDGMSLSSRAVHKELLKQGANAQYTEFPGTDHISSAGKAWGNQKHISWLFQQKRPNNLRSPACATPALP